MGGLLLVNQGVYIESCILSTPQWARLRTRRFSFKLCWWPQIKTEPLYTLHKAERDALRCPNLFYSSSGYKNCE